MLQIAPADFRGTSGLANQARKPQAVLAKVLRHAECRTYPAKRVEYGSDCLLNLLISVQPNPAFIVIGEAKRSRRLQFVPVGLVQHPAAHPRADKVECRLDH